MPATSAGLARCRPGEPGRKLNVIVPPTTSSGGRIAPAMALISVVLPELDSPASP